MARTAAARLFLLALAMAAAACLVAGDADSVLDFCVGGADPAYSVRPTGDACKKPADVVSGDFKFTVAPAPAAGRFKLGISPAFSAQWPALNAQGVSILRLDFARSGLVPPHTHPRASEIFYVTRGAVLSGFVATDGTLYQEVVKAGQAFVFPKGLIHFQKNVGKGRAAGISSFNSQNPGLQLTSGALLASSPKIDPSILAQDWNVDASVVTTVGTAYAS